METKLIKKSLLIIILAMTTACSDIKGKNMNVIYYGTDEFKKYAKDAIIKPKEAYKLSNIFYKNNNGENKNHSFPIYFIINDFYIFSPDVNLKNPKSTISGIWVNSQTGKTKYVKDDIELRRKSMNGWVFN